MTRISLPETERGGLGAGAFLAFKLHQFISGAGEVFTTLTEKPRNVLFEGQLEDPSAPGHRLYPTRFCRECGHEVHVVAKTEDAEGALFLPRNIDDAPLDDQVAENLGRSAALVERNTCDIGHASRPGGMNSYRNGQSANGTSRALAH